MISKVKSAAIIGIDAVSVCVEVDASRGLPNEQIVGLADKAIKESKNRVKAAIKQSGFTYPIMAFTINLAPADLPKEGAMFDLPIAAAMLIATQQLNLPDDVYMSGELGLDGQVKPIHGALCISDLVKRNGCKKIILPIDNAKEAALITDIDIYAISHLKDLPSLLAHTKFIFPKTEIKQAAFTLDFIDVKGQFTAKRALEIAATGHHNLLLSGSPGSGKSMLLKRLPSILSPLTSAELIECYKIASVSKSKNDISAYTLQRPFRSPHHSISYAGMAGGGTKPLPGEISHAHLGVLFLDEFPEFSRKVIEVLRQPLEDKELSICRGNLSITYPSNVILAACMNPCPCGYFNDNRKSCTCSPYDLQRYQKKISGPILDRIDIHLNIPRLNKEDFSDQIHPLQSNYDSKSMKNRVLAAHQFQKSRNQIEHNANLSESELATYCELDQSSKSLLLNCVDQGLLSGRSYTSILKVARSISDLALDKKISKSSILEALQYKRIES
eukprot:COSAG01_NODE_7674_length_3103_cov_45.812305_2_plen_500_part_00